MRPNDNFNVDSKIEAEGLYTPDHDKYLEDENYLGFPGEYPYLRGIHPAGYRSRLWTMRMFAGFGTAEDTNTRFKYLASSGQTGLSVAFDMPTLYGYDTDDPIARGEFGRCGVAISSLADMEILFKDIPLNKTSTSMTINGPAAVIWAMYIVAAENQGVAIHDLAGTIQNDILKEYSAQNEYIFPPEPSMSLVTDTIEFATKYMPKWNPISISGYHIREAGSTAVQEIAFTLADGFEYVDWCLRRGLDIDDFAPRLSFFFNVHNNFFEEIAKFRAARKIWAEEISRRFRTKNPRSLWMRFHAQTAGYSLTAQQPDNNIVRVSLQALAAVLGGCQSLHTNSMDEAWALPSEKAVLLALRTQQIIAEESGVADTVDPLGGSYYLETLTRQIESDTYKYFDHINDMGGILNAINSGFIQGEIADSAYKYQMNIDKKKHLIVGVNSFITEDVANIPLLKIDMEGADRQTRRLNEIRRIRNNRKVKNTLRSLETAIKESKNLMIPIIDAVKAYATLGEIMNVLRNQYGEYTPNWNL